MRHLIFVTILAVGLASGCGSDASSQGDSSQPADADQHDAVDGASGTDAGQGDDAAGDASNGDVALAPPWDPSEPLGGDRSADVLLPDDYTTTRSWPLVVLLHGYSASSTLQDAYFGLSRRRTQRGFIAVLPDGTRDMNGNRFWNATDACCDFANSGTDDVAYLSGLVAEAKERLAVDADRVYFIGHSNGGFMSYRMACELGSEITAIASLAGSSFDNAEDCAEDGQVGVLQIHGDADDTVLYGGGVFFGDAYPGAQEVVERWAARNGCDEEPTSGEAIDVDSDIDGAETEVDQWANCEPGTSVELWTIVDGGHIPPLNHDVTDRILDFLWAHE